MNLKYILIVVILATIVGGGILGYQFLIVPKEEPKVPEIKPPEEASAVIPEVEEKEETKAPSEEAVEDETANWKVYTNKKLGYTIKYPEGAVISEDYIGDIFVISPDFIKTDSLRGYLLELGVGSFRHEKLSLNFRENVVNEIQREGSEIILEKIVIIDNREGVYVELKPPEGFEVIYLPFPEGGIEAVFGIILDYGQAKGEREKNLDIVEKIYTSLKF